MKIETLLAQAGSRADKATGAVSTPIYQTATFRHPGLGQSTGYDYSRSGNPTRAALEDTLAALDSGAGAFAFASGLAAIATTLHLFSPGDRLLVTEDLYGGTFRLLEKVFGRLGLAATYVDTTDAAKVKAAFTPDVKGVLVELPTNPLLKVADLKGIARIAKARGALLLVDNTFLTGALVRPIELGADIVLYSASKYLAGHNDVVAGAAVAATKELAEKLYFHQNAIGAVLGPQDSWLALRGLKTLSLRLERQCANALSVARYLAAHPAVAEVHYPGLETDAGHERLRELSKGFGGMVAFRLKDKTKVEHVLANVEVFLFAESLGGVESLITFPAVQTHADIAPETRQRLGITDDLLRLSIGIEDAGDLVADLAKVLA